MPPVPALVLSGQPDHDVSGYDIELSYRRLPVAADLLRAGTGLGLTLLPILLLAPPWPVALGLLALAALFAAFLRQTWQRRQLQVRLEPDGITLIGRHQRHLAWCELAGLRLRWFGPHQPGRGWLDLELRGRQGAITVTSALDGFELVLRRALDAAERNGIALEPVTQANLAAAEALQRREEARRPGRKA